MALAMLLAPMPAAYVGAQTTATAGSGQGDATQQIPVEGRIVSFQTEDGVRLAGTLYGRGEPAVILAHQGTAGADQSTWRQFAMVLAADGFSALAFDFRGVGLSEGRLEYAFLDMDVRAAARFLRSLEYRRIACVGASMGGTACMRAAIEGEPFIGIVVLSSTLAAGNYYELEVLPEELGALILPKLFISARDDYGMVVRDTMYMAELAPAPKSLILLDGYEHGTSLFGTEAGDELKNDLLGFLKGLR